VIVSVTLNPSVDVPIALDEVRLGATNRCISSSVEPGGKGLNASRVVHRLGAETIAYGFAGGITGALLRRRLDDEGVPHAFDEIDELTRMDVMLYERALDRRTRLLPIGPHLGKEQLQRVRVRLALLDERTIAVFGGSVPPGLAPDVYASFLGALVPRGVRCIVDASGEALAAALAAHPSLIKPNEEEAAEVVGLPVRDDAEALAAARVLREGGAQAVVISQGERGAVGMDAGGAWKVEVPPIEARNTVGAGDSMVGGMAFALERGEPFAEMLRWGAAAGTASAMAPGRNLCSGAEAEAVLARVTVRPLGALARPA
jgi:1-phosphofructokinase family hexose kinase